MHFISSSYHHFMWKCPISCQTGCYETNWLISIHCDFQVTRAKKNVIFFCCCCFMILGAFLWTNNLCTVHSHCKNSQVWQCAIFPLPWDCDKVITTACISDIWRLTVRCKLENWKVHFVYYNYGFGYSVIKVVYLWPLTLMVQPHL